MPVRNLMATVSWDRKGAMMAEFMQQGAAMSKTYRETPK
jgi:hypothetical protein